MVANTNTDSKTGLRCNSDPQDLGVFQVVRNWQWFCSIFLLYKHTHSFMFGSVFINSYKSSTIIFKCFSKSHQQLLSFVNLIQVILNGRHCVKLDLVIVNLNMAYYVNNCMVYSLSTYVTDDLNVFTAWVRILALIRNKCKYLQK